MKVEATKVGYYGLKRRREKEEFDIDSDKEFSAKWMKKVGSLASPHAADADTPHETKATKAKRSVI